LAKIAVALKDAVEQRATNGAPGRVAQRILAQGKGWSVADVVCTHGPHDRSYEEQHYAYLIAIVVAGSFQYRGSRRRELMTPGSFVLGGYGQSFECGHEHHMGDRCLAFSFSPDYFQQVAADTGNARAEFPTLRLPPMRAFSHLAARACAGLMEPGGVPWEEIGLQLAGDTMQFVKSGDLSFSQDGAPLSSEARVTRVLRMIERHICDGLDVKIENLALEAGLSPYHFLRTFERVTGTSPHQYIVRMRLREAAIRLVAEPERILDIALDCGFGDVSNFNRAFRAEFAMSPRAYRKA